MVGMLWCLERGEEMSIIQLDRAKRHFEKKYNVPVAKILMNIADYKLVDTAITRAIFDVDEQTAKKGMKWNGVVIEPHTYIQPCHLQIYSTETL